MRRLLLVVVAALAAQVATAGAASQPLEVIVSAPRTVAFGDTFTLTVRAAVESEAVDPSSVQLEAPAAPFSALGAPVTRREGSAVVLTQRVACLEAGCVPAKTSPRQATLGRPTATGRRRDGTPVAVRGQPLSIGVTTRLSAQDIHALTPRYTRQTALRGATFRIAPALLLALLVAGAALLLALAVQLVRPRARHSDEAQRVTDEERLHRALRLARESVGRPAPDRRRALDLLADVLESRGAPGDDAVERLAWSQPEPSGAAVEQLVEQIGEAR